MKKQWFRVIACALLAAFIAAPSVNASVTEETDQEPASVPRVTSSRAPKTESDPQTEAASVPRVNAPAVNGAPAGDSSLTGAQGFAASKEYPFKTFRAWIQKCKETNPEVVGWLTVPGTSINEPVPLNATSNLHYEKRDWRGTDYPDITYMNWFSKPATASYLDCRTLLGEGWKKGTSRNLVIYGHNWNNLRDPIQVGTENGHDGRALNMFGELPFYTSLEFAQQNPYIYFSTGEYEGVWKVFAAAYCELSPKFNYNSPFNTNDKTAFANMIKEWQDRSLHDYSIEVDENDRLLTLSTCTRAHEMGDFERFVVVARLLRDGESENDPVTVTANPDWKRPKFG